MTQPLTPPPAAAAQASPLTLEAPQATQPVAATSAPKMAPAVPQEAIGQLDAKVDAYLQGLTTAQPKSPEFDTRTFGQGKLSGLVEATGRFEISREGAHVRLRPRQRRTGRS